MNFIADLHIHSRYSRATSRQLNPQSLAAWAVVKGLHVLGTGDFTHPGWREELKQELVRDEDTGLYRLKTPPDLSLALPDMEGVPGRKVERDDNAARGPLFLLQAEVSSIYKRHGKVRKVHNLVFMPDMHSAEKLSRTLEGVGNLASDGRPILGLDSRNLLEMVLEADPRGVVVPAHIWTPWFAIFGSKSGFDSMEECFGDLTSHIFALETGLSSDPAMNRLWSHLDGYTLISNSDAHSGANLGREANLFTGRPGYDGIFNALRRQEDASCRYAGTVEFFPEEGKYHLDGHRACNVVLEPEESRKLNNICPECGKPLTIGVLHRVMALADRHEPVLAPAEDGCKALIPLPELLGELLGVGAQSRRVTESYTKLIAALGSEMHILHTLPEDQLRRHWEGLGEGIGRMRRGEVIRQGGYDGEYGTVRVFTAQEAASFRSGRSRGKLLDEKATGLLALATPPRPAALAAPAPALPSPEPSAPALPISGSPSLPADAAPYTPEQQAALSAGPQPVLVMAGPGAGKTHTLMGRVAHLLAQHVPAQDIVVVTFTRRAAEELRQRLHVLLPAGGEQDMPHCDTLHALAWALLREQNARAETAPANEPVLLGEEGAYKVFVAANTHLSKAEQKRAWEQLSLARETRCWDGVSEETEACLRNYGVHKAASGWLDYTDLLELWLARLEAEHTFASHPRHLLVDEVQDLSPLQWAILCRLVPQGGQGFFGIGDPDQAIYGFRGAQNQVAAFVRGLWPETEVHSLTQSHRAAPGILACANALLGTEGQCGVLHARHAQRSCRLHLFSAPNAEAEARWVADSVRTLLGQSSHTLHDAADAHAATVGLAPESALAPGDVAVLVRLKAQMAPLHKALVQAGIPCAVPEQEGCWHDNRVALMLEQARQHYSTSPGAGAVLSPDWPSTPDNVWAGGLVTLRAHLEKHNFGDTLFWDSVAWKALRALWEEMPSDWPSLLSRVALLRDVEMARRRAERVQILTLHAAKGLEFAAVFLPGMEEGLLPLDRAALWGETRHEPLAGVDAASVLAEERRLAYVGVTRAARMLFCSHAVRRRWMGRELCLPPSAFLQAVRPLCRNTTLKAHSQKNSQQLRLF